MYLKSSNKVDVNRYELEIEVSPEEFNKAIDGIYQREKNRISVPGFRKGKAPRSFIEKYYGAEIFFEDAINSIYPDVLEESSKEAGLELVDDKIDFELIKASKNDGLHFKVKVTVMPEVEIGDYKGIEISKKDVSISEKDLEDALEEAQIKNGRLVSIEGRNAQVGDTVNIDFEGFIDGKKFDGGSAENFAVELGKHQFVKGFEEQIVGKGMGEKFDVNVKFPDDYHASAIAGKPAVFKVTLNEIKRLELPEINDEFVKDISEFDTLDEFKKDLEKKVAKKKEAQAKKETEEEIFGKLSKLIKADIPEALIKGKQKELLRDFEYNLGSQGIRFEDYIKYTGNDISKLEESLRPQAEESVKIDLALRKISELENIKPTDEEIAKEYDVLSKRYNMDVSRVKRIAHEPDVIKDLKFRKAISIVRDNCVVK